MSIANLIRRLGELGATPEMIAIAVDEIEADRQCLEARRAADRERKREQREREKEARKSANVTGHGALCHSERVSLDKETPPTPPKEIKPFPHTQGARGKVKHPLPANWMPAPLKPDGEAGRIAAAWQPGRIERELSKFKDHALQNRRLCACWDAAWRNWIKRAGDFERPTNERDSNPTAIALQRVAGAFGANH